MGEPESQQRRVDAPPYVAFTAGKSEHVYVGPANGTGFQDLGPGSGPIWSPDGSTLAYHTGTSEDDGCSHRLMIWRRGELKPKLIHESMSCYPAPVWSSDSKSLFFLKFDPVEKSSQAGKAKKPLDEALDELLDMPASGWIVDVATGKKASIGIVDPGGLMVCDEEQTVASAIPGTPNFLVNMGSQDGESRVWIVDPYANKIKDLGKGALEGVSPDGKYGTLMDKRHLWTVELSTGTRSKVAFLCDCIVPHVEWMPNSSGLICFDAYEGWLRLMSPTGQVMRRISETNECAWISPNGAKAVLNRSEGRIEDLCQIELFDFASGKTELGAKGDLYPLGWSSDGSNFFYSEFDDEADETVRALALPGAPPFKPLKLGDDEEVEMSADGKWLIVTSLDGGAKVFDSKSNSWLTITKSNIGTIALTR